MSPLEVMAKAVWDRFSGGRIPWEEVGERAREGMLGDMRAALLALAEAEFPDDVAQAGGMAGNTLDVTAIRCFRGMARAIAEGKG